MQIRERRTAGTSAKIDFAAGSGAHDPDLTSLVVYLVDYAVVPPADTPVVVRTGQLATSRRSRFEGQVPDLHDASPKRRRIQSAQVALN